MDCFSGLRDQLVTEGKIRNKDADFYYFVEDVPFQSASAASSVVLARQSSGPTIWKMENNNQVTYRDWQTSMMPSTD